MIDLSVWQNTFLRALENTFGSRAWFVGLQGSYARGEATETRDTDTVVILDQLNASDIQTYRAMLDSLPHRELICGFLSGKDELLNWDAADLFQFYHDTTPIKGSLDALLPLLDASAVQRAIHTSACNLYHGCVHNMLHEKSDEILHGLYKSASFVVQAIAFCQTGRYIRRQHELLHAVSADERVIVETFLRIKRGEPGSFQAMSETLFNWSRKWIEKTA